MRRSRTPVGVAAGLALVVIVSLPFAGVAGPVVPGWLPAWCAVVFLCDAVTTVLLFGLWRSGRGLRMLVLATAFAWSAIIMALLAFALPGVLGADGRLGVEVENSWWLYVSRHVGPPLLIAIALSPWPAAWEDRANADPRINRRAVGVALAVLLLGPGSAALGIIALPDVLPQIVERATGQFLTGTLGLLLAVNAVAVVVALVGVTGRREGSGVEVWAIVAACAWLGDVALMAMYEDPYTIAYYGARLMGLVASVIVAARILADTWWAHQQVMEGAHDLEEQVERLLEAQRLRDHVSAVVSHDMRTPLAGLQGYLEVLVDDPELDRELVQRMHERSLVLTRRLTLLCEDLLAATTGEHSDLVMSPADLDLSEQLAESAAGFPELDLRIDCPPGVHVHADPLRLQQILTNLVRNAEKHGAEPVTIDVSSSATEVTIRVRDAGEGVPETFIPRLFDRYSQGARADGGAGIGLSVVHDLVQAQGGSIRYDLTDPAFIVTLLVAPPSEPLPERPVLTAPTRGRDST